MSRRKHTAAQVMRALDELINEDPERVDRRAATGRLECRYVEHGRPACLAAAVLDRMGFSTGLLKTLDHELRDGSVLLWGSRTPIRRRFSDPAWELLSALQACNDNGQTWEQARANVMDPHTWIGRRWHLTSVGRPWMEEM